MLKICQNIGDNLLVLLIWFESFYRLLSQLKTGLYENVIQNSCVNEHLHSDKKLCEKYWSVVLWKLYLKMSGMIRAYKYKDNMLTET